ncbi:MAG: glycoside hydrolase family 97 protein [Kiritimatiellae bacterium]|nr:glycoside hydrolase family 97 protein [Kiritimatiellia bacterium]
MRSRWIPASAALLFAAGAASFGEETNLVVTSPDGRLGVSFLIRGGAPHYAVAHAGTEVIHPSALGFTLKDAPPLTNGFEVVEVRRGLIDETWRPVWGTAAEVRNHCNELRAELRERDAPHREMSLVFRAYDDGAAFRYVLPAQSNLAAVAIASEETTFRFGGDYTAWWHPVNYDGDEDTYRTTPLSQMRGINTPVTMRTGAGLHLSIHEAALLDYASMTLVPVDGEPRAFRCDLVPWPDGVKVKASTPMKTPWRTIQVAERAGGLLESHLIENLNEPCALADTSWIEPMKYMGIWWGMHIGKETWSAGPNHGATTENAKHYIDFAASNGIRGVLVEGWNKGWETWFHGDGFSFVEPYPDFDLEAVAAYAQEKGVAFIGHHETGGNIPGYEAEMDAALAQYERLGVRAVKTGYAGEILPKGQHHHGQWMVNHYQRVVEKAAAHRIALDVHEPIKFTGLSRTWPNLMTGEGVRGTEYEAWSDGNPPEHTTIIPFTRGLGGPMDYTPGIFALTFPKYREGRRVHTTLAKQLALYVVLFSPLQMAADLPENYEGQPAFQFIRDVPVTWDETRTLDAAIGDFVLIARRKGSDWFVGAITDESSRRLKVPLSFLDPGREYQATLYVDGREADWEKNPTALEIRSLTVRAEDTLRLPLAPGGGAAVRIRPREQEN